MNAKPYFETVRDVYVDAAAKLYKAAVEADPETSDADGYLRRGNEMRDMALETWTLTTRQENYLGRLKARAELATPEGREMHRIVAKLTQ